jgi:hypothetical protein
VAHEYKEKQAILTLKLDYIQKRISKWYHIQEQITPYEDLYLLMEQKEKMIKKFNKNYKTHLAAAWEKSTLLNHARYKRKKRIKNKIEKLVLDGNSSFITLTFNDKVIDATSEITRRRYVSRWCKANSDFYVSNIDYGDKTHREHYHAVLRVGTYSSWNYGFMSKKQIRSKSKDLEKISKYVSKLTNHAMKKSGKLKRIIYSKNII